MRCWVVCDYACVGSKNFKEFLGTTRKKTRALVKKSFRHYKRGVQK